MVVDDHQLFREGIKCILSKNKDIMVVCEASNGEEAIVQANIHKPDIILLDIVMPKISGMEVIGKLKDLGIKSKVIILSAFSSRNHIIDSIKLGASAYISKDNSSDTLVSTIRHIYSGGKYLQPSLGKLLLQNVEEHNNKEISINKIALLSNREYEVLRLLATGCNNKEIGNNLYISEKTVKNHLTSIFKKIEVEDRLQAVIFAYINEIIDIN